MSPLHSIGFCPVCGGGLCGVRICGAGAQRQGTGPQGPVSDEAHGMVICDECEAIWLMPDLDSEHQYPDVEDARCPICYEPMWGPASRWADWSDVNALGWEQAIDRRLDTTTDGEIV